MKKTIQRLFSVLLLTAFLYLPAAAQDERSAYTSNNTIVVVLEGVGQRYEFISKQMLVRHNKETHMLECVLQVASLLPLNDTIPAKMAYEVLYGAKYPELTIFVAAPDQQAKQVRYKPSSPNRTISVNLQGVNNETREPVAFLKDKSTVYFSTNLDLMLDNFQASMPVKYLPLLTGRILINIDKAYWYNLSGN